MPKRSSHEVTDLLLAWRRGEKEALDKVMPLVYQELRRLAHQYLQRERKGHDLETTALINETYLRLMDCNKLKWKDRAHFFAVTAKLMRRILVDYARSNHYQKREGELAEVSLGQTRISSGAREPVLVALDEALDVLATLDARKSRVVELRFFGGLSVKETAEVLGVCYDTVMRDWRFAKAWLMREISKPGVPDSGSHAAG